MRLRAAGRFAAGLRPFLRAKLDLAACEAGIRARLDRRERDFCTLVEQGAIGRPESPYRPLFAAAGIEAGDLRRLVGEHGVEGALERLHRAGVRLSLDEFKGRRPLERGGAPLDPQAGHFDNPLLLRHYTGRTSGSRGAGTRVAIDLDLLEQEACHHGVVAHDCDEVDRPLIVWRSVPPGLAGLKTLLRQSKAGLQSDAWFTPTAPPDGLGGVPFRALTAGVVAVSRLAGPALPRPRRLELDQAEGLAALLERRAAGVGRVVSTPWSSAVRICEAADGAGRGLEGIHFMVGGEPTTTHRAAAIEATGARFFVRYSMGEVGRIGEPCSRRREPDDVHLLDDKVAVLQPDGAGGELVISSVSPAAPKLMINVESGDVGRIERRRCECAFGRLGMDRVLSGIHSREKLTAEGMNLTAAQISRLLEEELPDRLGGPPSRYQLVSRLDGAGAGVAIVVGVDCAHDDERVRRVVNDCLADLGPEVAMMVEHWRQAGGIGVLRRDPLPTLAGKIQQLHLARAGELDVQS